MEEVRLYFVIPFGCPDENECSEEMQQAFVICEQNISSGLKAKWIHEKECPDLNTLTKKDVFVLHKFAGPFYDKLHSAKCFIIGPRCLSCCWTEGCEIPSGSEPVFTIAMRSMKVSSSGFTKAVKESIKEKVCWMGGKYMDRLSDDTTHLVCDKALSDKYCKAAENNLPIMSESWVHAVWGASLTTNVHATSPQFNSHKLPIFQKLQVTCTGLGRKEKDAVTKMVNDNGGIFTGAFKSESTDIVILNKSGLGSQKHKAAVEFGKICVLPTWVRASVERGHAQPPHAYRVTGAATSSPLSGSRLPDMSLNFSTITNLRPASNHVDETQNTECSMMTSGKMKGSQECKKSDETSTLEKDILAAIENFDMSQVKKAGPLFDGFCIYVCGLEGGARDRVSALVSRAGGVRYDAPHARVTHALAGTRVAAGAARRQLPDVPVLSPLWLTRSVCAARVLDEKEYLISDAAPTSAESSSKASKKPPSLEPSSPMSKRNLQLLRPGSGPSLRPPVPKFTIEPEDGPDEASIVKQYVDAAKEEGNALNNKEGKQDGTSSADENVSTSKRSSKEDQTSRQSGEGDTTMEEIEQIFAGIRIELQCIEESSVEVIAAEVSRAGGRVVRAGAGGDYALVPLDWDAADLDAGPQVVTVFWLRDCLNQSALLTPQYYHKPVNVGAGGSDMLAGVVLSISTYSGVERMFLDEVAQLLGATSQMRFCRRTTATTLASTHLLCPEPSGDKYLGAVKWGLPAVRGDWLMACVAAGRRVSEAPYIVGDTKAPAWVDSMEESERVAAPDKENFDEDMAPPAESIVAPHRRSPEDPADSIGPRRQSSKGPADSVVPRRQSSKDDTPIKRFQNAANVDDMSPASRYIAMARQGLLVGDSQETPKRVTELKRDSICAADAGNMQTPPLNDALATPNLANFSPTTRRRLQAIKRGEMPSGPLRTPANPFERAVPTPDSGYGAVLRPHAGRLSPESRKQLYSFVQDLPELQQHEEKRETPLSEICNRYLDRFNPNACVSRKLEVDDAETPPSKIAKKDGETRVRREKDGEHKTGLEKDTGTPSSSKSVIDKQLQQLSMLVEAHSSRVRKQSIAATQRTATPINLLPQGEAVTSSGPDSQVNTVGWDDSSQLRHIADKIDSPLPHAEPPPPPKPRIFVLCSNVENPEEISRQVLGLGGAVRGGEGVDADVTHVLCAVLSRSERTLTAVAAGKWLLHPAFVADSHAAGVFLEEENYEWGNERASSVLPALEARASGLARAAHRWRVERSRGRPGPFDGMRVVLHMPPARKQTIERLLAAGGATVLTEKSPYGCADATHCFAETHKLPLAERDLRFFAERDVPVCPPIFITNYLGDDRPDAKRNCLPEYQQIYNRLRNK